MPGKEKDKTKKKRPSTASKPKKRITVYKGGAAVMSSSAPAVASAPAAAAVATFARGVPDNVGVALPTQLPPNAWNVASIAQQNMASQHFSTMMPVDRSMTYTGGRKPRSKSNAKSSSGRSSTQGKKSSSAVSSKKKK